MMDQAAAMELPPARNDREHRLTESNHPEPQLRVPGMLGRSQSDRLLSTSLGKRDGELRVHSPQSTASEPRSEPEVLDAEPPGETGNDRCRPVPGGRQFDPADRCVRFRKCFRETLPSDLPARRDDP